MYLKILDHLFCHNFWGPNFICENILISVPSWAQWHLITRPCTWWVFNHWHEPLEWPHQPCLSTACSCQTYTKKRLSIFACEAKCIGQRKDNQNSLLSCNPRFNKHKQKCILRIPSNPYLDGWIYVNIWTNDPRRCRCTIPYKIIKCGLLSAHPTCSTQRGQGSLKWWIQWQL